MACVLVSRREYDWQKAGVDPTTHAFGAVDKDQYRDGVRKALQPQLDQSTQVTHTHTHTHTHTLSLFQGYMVRVWPLQPAPYATAWCTAGIHILVALRY